MRAASDGHGCVTDGAWRSSQDDEVLGTLAEEARETGTRGASSGQRVKREGEQRGREGSQSLALRHSPCRCAPAVLFLPIDEHLLELIGLLDEDADTDGVDASLDEALLLLAASDHQRRKQQLLRQTEQAKAVATNAAE